MKIRTMMMPRPHGSCGAESSPHVMRLIITPDLVNNQRTQHNCNFDLDAAETRVALSTEGRTMSTLVSVAAAVLILAAAAPRPADAFVAPFGTLARRGHGRAMAAGRRPYGGASLAAAAGGELTGDDELLLAAVEEESGMLSDMDLFGDPEREREESLRSKQQAELVEAMEACLRDNDTVDIFSDGVAAGGDDDN